MFQMKAEHQSCSLSVVSAICQVPLGSINFVEKTCILMKSGIFQCMVHDDFRKILMRHYDTSDLLDGLNEN